MPEAASEADRPDLDAYFERIGYSGATSPTLDVLNAFQRLHPAAIPFEAIDVFLGRGIDLDPAAVQRKLIAGRRGGYCYEQNGYLRRVLDTLGFQVTGLIGRVQWQTAEDAPARPRTHMALKVRVRGNDWLVDVGFGGSTLTGPILWMLDTPQTTPHATYRLVAMGADTQLQQQVGDEWHRVYTLSPDPQIEADYRPVNWYASTHPESHFRANLIAARSPEGARLNLLNNRLTIRPVDGEPERRLLDADGLERCLRDDFGLPVQPDWRPALERAVAVGAAG